MGCLKALVLMQLKDKLDFSFTKSKKLFIRKIVFEILKFAAVAAISYLLCYVLTLLVLDKSDVPQMIVIVLTLLLGISIISCTIGLVKSLYFADDNKVLITFPVKNNVIFLSKLIVFYLYELVREYCLIVPVLLGMGVLNLVNLSVVFIPWMMIMMLLIPAAVVTFSALLSIPALYIARFANRYPISKIILFFIVAGFAVWGIVELIKIIPEDLDIINGGVAIKRGIKEFIASVCRVVLPITYLVSIITGERNSSLKYSIFNGTTAMRFGIFVLALVATVALVYFISRPLFFRMMSKSFEFEKKAVSKEKLNNPHGRKVAFLLKEFRLCILDTEVSLNFLTVYIAVPVMVLLLNKIYAAINTRLAGQVMTYAFTILVMMLPMLASNGMIAKLFSKEGHAAYMKKTEPVNILEPIFAKLSFFLVLSVPSLIVSVAIFGSFVHESFAWYDLVMLALTLIVVQWGHILFSALTDIMNPQNEQYATVGESAQNPNENKATITAFIISAFFAFFGYVLLNENPMITGAIVKLFIIGVVLFAVTLSLFIKVIKTYYYEK